MSASPSPCTGYCDFLRYVKPVFTMPHMKFHYLPSSFIEGEIEKIEWNNCTQVGSQRAKQIAGLMVTGQHVRHFEQSSMTLHIKF